MSFHDFRRAAQDSTGTKLRLALLLACSVASARLYLAVIRIIPKMTSAEPSGSGEVFPWVQRITHATLDSVAHKTDSFNYTVEFMACFAGLFALYVAMLFAVRGLQSRRFVALAAVAAAFFMAMLAHAPAMLSSDVYAYAHYGRLLANFGMDAHSPAAVAVAGTNKDDPFSLGGYYDFVASVYGPFWTVISAALVFLGGGHVGLTVLLLRGLEIVLALGCGGFIWAILKELAPERAAFGTILFLWNPLVIFESASGGHNDTCMMFFALLAAWLHLRRWKAGAVVSLALSALVKVITAPLVPLYILMVLRSSHTWKERAWFLARACAGVAAAVALSACLARMKPDGLLQQTASGAQFYENNYHEPLFKWLRRALGEPADSIETPMDFRTWWVAANGRAVLHAGISNKSADLCRLKPGQRLLATSDEDSDEWLRVYDPANGLQGYVNWRYIVVIEDPPDSQLTPTERRISGWPPDWPTVKESNRIIRVATWALFVAFGLLAAWKTVDFDSFILWSTAFFLAADLLVFTKIWPWYAVWPLALGALKPDSAPTRLAIYLSAGMIMLYALLDYSTTQWQWFYDYRSIPTIVLPVALFAIVQCCGLFRRRMSPA